jgi:hypothetical protein
MNPIIALFVVILVVILSIVVILIRHLNKETLKESIKIQGELKKERQTFFLPHQLEAYQRALLFLERIHPSSLIMRLNQPGLSALAMQSLLLRTIRDEYDHNVVQQLFISKHNWSLMKEAKEETVKLINIAASSMTPESSAMDFSTSLLTKTAEVNPLPSEIAIDAIKAEMRLLL